MLSDWSNWSDCSANVCNEKGKMNRTREIKVEAAYGGIACPTELVEMRNCFKNCKSKSN